MLWLWVCCMNSRSLEYITHKRLTNVLYIDLKMYILQYVMVMCLHGEWISWISDEWLQSPEIIGLSGCSCLTEYARINQKKNPKQQTFFGNESGAYVLWRSGERVWSYYLKIICQSGGSFLINMHKWTCIKNDFVNHHLVRHLPYYAVKSLLMRLFVCF